MFEKIKVIAGLAVLISTLTVMRASASVNVDVGGDGESINVKGVIESKTENIPIGIDVFAPESNYNDLISAERKDVLKVLPYRTEVISGKGGQWTINFKIIDNPDVDGDCKSGIYTVIVYPQDSYKAETQSFLFTNQNDLKKNYKIIADAENSEVIREMLEANIYGVGVPYEFYVQLDKKSIAEMLYYYKTNNVFDSDNVTQCGDVLRKTAIFQAVSEGKIDNIFDYSVQLELDSSDLGEFYKKEYAVSLYKTVTSYLKGINVIKPDDFYEKLYESFVLCVTENNDGVGNAKEVIDKFSAKIGITPSDDLEVYREIIGVKYESFDLLKTAYENALKKEPSANESKSSSGGKSTGISSITSPTVSGNNTDNRIPADIFTDIDSVIWAKEAIVYLAEKNIISGKAKSLFYPEDNITREEFVKIAVLSFVPDGKAKSITFSDVDMTKWYAEYIAKAYGAGILKGYDDNTFGVSGNITRQDIAVILYRTAKLRGIIEDSEATVKFKDIDDISEYAKTAVAALADKGIITGRENGTFDPLSYATRAETAKMVYRMLML